MATAAASKVKARKPVQIQPLIYRSVVTLYRIFGILTLYLVLAGILSYAFVMGFYAVNSSWAAPVILAPSDDKSLDFIQKIVTSKQTLEDLKVDEKRLESSISEMARHRTSLLSLEPELQAAIVRERTHNRAAGPQLAQLDQQKQADILKTQAIIAQVKQVESIDRQRPGRRTYYQGRCSHPARGPEPGTNRPTPIARSMKSC